MRYRNKTYVIFDGDGDMWAYRYMRGWNAQDHMDFDFYDAHDIRPLTERAAISLRHQQAGHPMHFYPAVSIAGG